MDNYINNPVEEIVPRSTMATNTSWDIIPATIRSLNDLNLTRTQVFVLLVTGIVGIAGTTVYYISKKKDDDPKCTIGTKIKQDKKTKTHVDNVTVNETLLNNGSTVGVHADVTDDAELYINGVTVNA